MDRENAGAASGKRDEDEEPAGVPGMVTRKAFGSFERRLNGERRLDKGIDMERKIITVIDIYMCTNVNREI